MAFSSVGTLASGGNTTANQSTLTVATTAALAADDFVVVVVAVDNRTSSDGDDNAVTGVTIGGNAAIKALCFAAAGGAAQAGASCSIFYWKATGTVASGSNIVATFQTNTTSDAQALTAWKFTTGAGTTISVEATNTAAQTGSVDLGALDATTSNRECLRVRGVAVEATAATSSFTPTATWTELTEASSVASGTSTVEMGARGECIISTGTGQSSDPTMTVSASCEAASCYVAFRESATSSVSVGETNAVAETTDATKVAAAVAVDIYGGASLLVRRRRSVVAPSVFESYRRQTITIADSVNETAAAADAPSAVAIAVGTIAESAAAADAPSASSLSAVAETSGTTESQDAARSTPATIAESAAATDAPNQSVTTAAAIAESAAAADVDREGFFLTLVGGGYLLQTDGSRLKQLSTTGNVDVAVDEAAAAADATNPIGAGTAYTGADILVRRRRAVVARSVFDFLRQMPPVGPPAIFESSAATDAESAAVTFASTVAESAAGADGLSAVALGAATATETAAAVDATNATVAGQQIPRGYFSGAEPIIRSSRRGRPPISTTVVIQRAIGQPVSLAEIATASDAINTSQELAVHVPETAAVGDSSDALQIPPAGLAETAAANDILGAARLVPGTVAETSAVTDASTVARLVPAAVAEIVATDDSSSVARLVFANVQETAGASDAPSATAIFLVERPDELTAVSDIAAATSFAPVSIAEAAIATESAAAGGGVAIGSTSEAASAADAPSAMVAAGGVVLEAAAADDGRSVALAAVGSVAESATVADLPTVAASMGIAVLESAAVSDDWQGNRGPLVIIGETAGASDSPAAVKRTSGVRSDAVTTDDAIVAVQVTNPSAAEAVGTADAILAGSIIDVAVAENSAADDVGASFADFAAMLAESAPSGSTQGVAIIVRPAISEDVEAVDGQGIISAVLVAAIAELSAAIDNPTNDRDVAISEMVAATDMPSATLFPFGRTVHGTPISGRGPIRGAISGEMQPGIDIKGSR